jgi:hypothetical protein
VTTAPAAGPSRGGRDEAAHAQPWSEVRDRRRPRLLVEDPHAAFEVAEFRCFEDAGFDVAVCTGPGEGVPCPLEEGADCRLAELADVVVMGPGMAPHRAAVAAEMHRRRPEVPVVVQMRRDDPGQCPPGCIAQYAPASIEGQIRSVWNALDR